MAAGEHLRAGCARGGGGGVGAQGPPGHGGVLRAGCHRRHAQGGPRGQRGDAAREPGEEAGRRRRGSSHLDGAAGGLPDVPGDAAVPQGRGIGAVQEVQPRQGTHSAVVGRHLGTL